jgi:hypothetical protein
MNPIADPAYNALKQKRYRARLRAQERAGNAAPSLTTTDAATLAATTVAFLQIVSASADLLARRLQTHLSADRGLASRTG